MGIHRFKNQKKIPYGNGGLLLFLLAAAYDVYNK